MGRVVHFELPVDDADRASAFYEKVFGWKMDKQEGPWGTYLALITGEDDEPGISGALAPRQAESDVIVNTIDTSDIDNAIAKVEENGGKITFAKCPIAGVGYLAYFVDDAGNMWGMMQRDPSVK
ncbi:MAG: VOC family protein [Candidatus Thorarchaeota archaeon]|jgi:predicted enzyme related to lactoylglutathione lyase